MRVYEIHPATFDLTLIDNARREYLVARNSKKAEQKFILKLLGDVYHPASLNLRDRYLVKYLQENDPCREALAKIFERPSILLIGFEPDDPDFKGLLANKTIFKSTPKPNQYTILIERKLEQSLKVQQSLKAKKIVPIWYESEAELVNILEKIVLFLGMQPITEKKTKSDADIQQSPLQPEKNVGSTFHSETEPVHIFISWAPQDRLPMESLAKHLRPLLDNRKISIWAGEELGIDRDFEVQKHMNEARIFLPLISADFFMSEPCLVDLGMAINRYLTEKANQRGKMTIRIIPILIRSYSWEDTRIGKLKLPSLPKDGKPVMESEHRDQAFSRIAQDIKRVVEELSQETDIQEKSS